MNANAISVAELQSSRARGPSPIVVDVRPGRDYRAAGETIAVSLGLSRLFADDHEMLAQGMVLYDVLYAWCKEGQDEVHTWNPQAYR